MVDAHTIATFAFAQMRRDPAFGSNFPWVHNTVVCVDSDLAEDVLSGQMVHYFAETGGTIACYYPHEKRFMFIQVGVPTVAKEGEPPPTPPPPQPGVRQVQDSLENPMTIGEIVNAIYARRQGDYSDLPVWDGRGFRGAIEKQPLVGEASTAEVEKKLAFT